MQLRRSIGILGRHVMRFTLISDQDIPDPHPPILRVWLSGGPRASGDEGGLRDASGKASLRYNSPGRAWPASSRGCQSRFTAAGAAPLRTSAPAVGHL